MMEKYRQNFRLSFISSSMPLVVLPTAELLMRLRSAAVWDEASIHPAESDFPRIHIRWHPTAGFKVHCFENEQSCGHFLATDLGFSLPSIEINLGGQALERWPRELFVPEDLATEALEHFLKHGELKPLLSWIGTGRFARETIWEGREEREAWERANCGGGN
jgi:hypothetical protein